MSAIRPASKLNVKAVDVDRIDPDPEQPRKVFEEAELKELAASMQAMGQLQPIAVRYDKSTRRYMLVLGERRWRAALFGGLPTLNAQIFDIDDDRAFEMQIAENVNRADMTPLEEARAYDKLHRRGWSVERVAGAYGKGIPYIQWRIDLLNLNDDAKDLVEKGQLPVNAAWYVCTLSADAQNRFLVKYARGDLKTARDAEEFARACRHIEAQGSFFDLEPKQHDEEAQEKVAAGRRQVVSKIDRLASAGEILSEIADTDPVELARLLGGADGGIGAYQDRVVHLRAAAGRAVTALRKAAAIVAATTVDLNPDLTEQQAPEGEPGSDDLEPVGEPVDEVPVADDDVASGKPVLRLVTDEMTDGSEADLVEM